MRISALRPQGLGATRNSAVRLSLCLAWVVPFSILPGRALTAQSTSPFGAGSDPDMAPYHAQVFSTRNVEDLSWPEIEPSQNVFTFAEADQGVRDFNAVGMEVMFKVKTCALTLEGDLFWATLAPPPGAKEPPGVCASMPAKYGADYSDFIFKLVDHYKNAIPGGRPVRYFAINNEVNAPNQWSGKPGRKRCVIDEATGASDCPVFQDYLRLLRRAHTAAHNANPNVVILDSGLGSRVWGAAIARDIYESKGKTNAALNEAVAFYNKFFAPRYSSPAAAGIFYISPSPSSTLRQRWEALIFAPYDPEKSPTLTSFVGDRYYYFAKHIFDDPTALDGLQLHFYDEWSLTDDVLDWIQKQMDQRWGAGNRKPIMCWECGSHWAVADVDGDGNGNYFNYSVDDHAAGLSKRFIFGLSRGMAQLIHLPLDWGVKSDEDDQFRSPPLICARGSQAEPQLCNGVIDFYRLTPLGKAFRQIASTFVGYTSVTPVTGLTGVEGYKFKFATFSIAALWSANGATRTTDLRPLGTLQSVSDQYGVVLTSPPVTSFPLTGRVTYVKVK